MKPTVQRITEQRAYNWRRMSHTLQSSKWKPSAHQWFLKRWVTFKISRSMIRSTGWRCRLLIRLKIYLAMENTIVTQYRHKSDPQNTTTTKKKTLSSVMKCLILRFMDSWFQLQQQKQKKKGKEKERNYGSPVHQSLLQQCFFILSSLQPTPPPASII